MSILTKLINVKDFTEIELTLSKYILDNYKSVKGMKITELAKNSFVSTSAITRLCKKIGFNGYHEFKMKFIAEITELEKQENIFEDVDINGELNTQKIIDKVNSLSIETINKNKEFQDVSIIDKVVSLISEKKVIDLYGEGASYIVCLDLQYKLMRAGKIVNLYNSEDKRKIQAINSNNDHLGIIISYSGKTKSMIDIVNILYQKQIETVSITKLDQNTEIAKKCGYNLFVASKEANYRSAAIYSRLATLNLIDVIYLKYANLNYENMLIRIGETRVDKLNT